MIANLTPAQKEDMVASLAALLLHDAGKEITSDNIDAVVKASGNTVAAYWGMLYSQFAGARDLDDLLLKPGMGGGAAVAGGAAAGGDAAAAEPEEESEEEEESAGGAGGLFDDDEDDW